MLLMTNASREFNALRQRPAGVSGCGCGGKCGCCSDGPGLGLYLPVQASSEFIALTQRPAGGLGQFTATTNATGTVTPAAAGSLVVGGFDVSWLENAISLFGFNVPFWALGAAGVGALVGALMLFGRGGGRRR